MNELDSNAVNRDEIKSIIGDLAEDKIIEIVELQPTSSELEQAMMWAAGCGDALGKGGHQMTGKISQLVDIITADEEDDPPRPI